MTVNPKDFGPSRLTRRQFLAGAAAGAAFTLGEIASGGDAPRGSRSAEAQAAGRCAPWWMRPPFTKSRVVEVSTEARLVSATTSSAELAGTMFEKGLTTLTGSGSVEEGWRSLLGSARRILLKFNHVGAEVLATNGLLARVLVDSLSKAGFQADEIALAEAPAALTAELGGWQPTIGWGSGVWVGARTEALARPFLEADVIVNIGQLKVHRLAGMSGCSKNISHAVIRRPALYHGTGCAPYIGEVWLGEEVSARVRLNLLAALRVGLKDGPVPEPSDVHDVGRLILSHDPFAADSAGLTLLETLRAREGYETRLEVPFLAGSAKAGVGRSGGPDVEALAVVV